MAVITTLDRTKVTLKLSDGQTATGGVKTVSLPFPSLNKEAFDAEKVMAIADKLNDVLSKTIYRIVKTDDSLLDSDE